MSKSSKKKVISDSYLHQINVLRLLSKDPPSIEQPRQYQLNEIAELSGLRDEKETQRYLFILEGQKLVAPFPAGDFTSKVWHITKQGMKTLKVINRATQVQ